MSEILEEFWIFSKEGEGLVNFYRDPNSTDSFSYRDISLDQQKLQAIQNLILSNLQDAEKKNKNIMEFENDIIKYGQCLENDLIIFYKTNPYVKEKVLINLCKVISGILEEIYPVDKLQFYDGNLSFFEKFKKKVRLYFKMSAL